jgi:hypothetical protein
VRLVHDDGTIHVQVRLPQALAEKDTVCHVLDDGRLQERERERERKIDI